MNWVRCPECDETTIELSRWLHPGGVVGTEIKRRAWPAAGSRPVAADVPDAIAELFREASEVLPISPRASAALSRRCLQQVLREHGNVESANLIAEIEQAVASGGFASALAEDLHAVRHVGNFAAHPTKDQHTGDVVDVEPGEAEWLLDVLEQLFDHYFVAPARRAARREALDAKLSAANKPTLPPSTAT